MATHLDLEEQEKLDEIKHFWNQYGNLITWVLIAVLGSFASWNAYQYWQKNQAAQAANMLDEVEKMTRSGDVQKIQRAFGDMKERFPKTTHAHQAGLLVSKALVELGQPEEAKSNLKWVLEAANDTGYGSIAKLRLSGILLDAKSYDEALKSLEGNDSKEFEALIADRKGDIYAALGKKNEAKVEYEKAYKTIDERAEYRRLVQIKLEALGAPALGDKDR